MARSNQTRAKRSGVTLIELLVVATIMLTLAAVSVPSIKPMMESQATSHAALTVSTYLERAKAHAVVTGRSCGVTFEFFPGTDAYDGSASLVLRQVEEQPFFSGFDFATSVAVGPDFCPDNPYLGESSRLVYRYDPDDPYSVSIYDGLPVYRVFPNYGVARQVSPYYLSDANQYNGPPPKTWLDEYFKTHAEAEIQFNSTGPFYPLIKWNREHRFNGGSYAEGVGYPPGGYEAGGTYYVVGTPDARLQAYDLASCKIRARGSRSLPVARMTAPVGVAQGTVVDLQFSGTDSRFFKKGADVTVMFSPTGGVDCVIDGGERSVPTETIYFLIGRWDRIAALGVANEGKESAAEDGLWNFEDGANFWVTINAQTGVVSTAEVNQPFAYALGDFATGVEESREFARFSKRNIGGR